MWLGRHIFAPPLGFEPSLKAPKASVLPLHHGGQSTFHLAKNMGVLPN